MDKILARRLAVLAVAASAVAGVVVTGCRPDTERVTSRPMERPTATAWPDIGLARPSEHTSWPWPRAVKSSPHRGVSHWLARSRDGTGVELLQFDLDANPNLKLEIYAQDEDDAQPMDNNIRFWAMGVGQAVSHLNHKAAGDKSGADGVVVAACNGPFFGYRRVSERVQNEIGFHLAPIVLRGRVFHNTGNHRWSFGVQYLAGRAHFKTFHLPGRNRLAREFDFASGTIQCLIKDGRALKLEPFPRGPRDFKKQPVPSTSEEAGHIPYFDHALFSRVALAWKSRADGSASKLFWLVVREPNSDSEGRSIEDLAAWKPQSRGWNVPDVQRFWLSMLKSGLVDNAVNSDAGDVAQLAFRLPGGDYEMASPIGDNPSFERKRFGPDFKGAPQGGALMYFAMRDAREKAAPN